MVRVTATKLPLRRSRDVVLDLIGRDDRDTLSEGDRGGTRFVSYNRSVKGIGRNRLQEGNQAGATSGGGGKRKGFLAEGRNTPCTASGCRVGGVVVLPMAEKVLEEVLGGRSWGIEVTYPCQKIRIRVG
eukprot:762783-Hanusia_phi.AAC.2